MYNSNTIEVDISLAVTARELENVITEAWYQVSPEKLYSAKFHISPIYWHKFVGLGFIRLAQHRGQVDRLFGIPVFIVSKHTPLTLCV